MRRVGDARRLTPLQHLLVFPMAQARAQETVHYSPHALPCVHRQVVRNSPHPRGHEQRAHRLQVLLPRVPQRAAAHVAVLLASPYDPNTRVSTVCSVYCKSSGTTSEQAPRRGRLQATPVLCVRRMGPVSRAEPSLQKSCAPLTPARASF